MDLGRFISRDPIEFDQRYGYAGGNPVLYVDPYGLLGWKDVGRAAGWTKDRVVDCAQNSACRTTSMIVVAAVAAPLVGATVGVGLGAGATAASAINAAEQGQRCLGGSKGACAAAAVEALPLASLKVAATLRAAVPATASGVTAAWNGSRSLGSAFGNVAAWGVHRGATQAVSVFENPTLQLLAALGPDLATAFAPSRAAAAGGPSWTGMQPKE